MNEEIFLHPSRENVKSFLSKLNDQELKELIFEVKPNFNIGYPGDVDNDLPPEPLHSDYKLTLTHCGEQKICVIKVIRDVLGAGLLESKKLAESCPSLIISGISFNRALEIQDLFDQAGAGSLIESSSSNTY